LSGIVGIFNQRGAPVEKQLPRELTQLLAYRGPDALEVWTDGAIGFGHAILQPSPVLPELLVARPSIRGLQFVIGEVDMNSATSPQRREPYFTPKLTIYGTIEKLTKTLGTKGAADGGTNSQNRTSM
jgi:hypothetical protein